MEKLSINDPAYFPDTLFVWHMTRFPSSFQIGFSKKDIPYEAEIVAIYSLRDISSVVREFHLESIENKGE